MNAMQHSVRGFTAALVALWLGGCIGSAYYAQSQHIPAFVSAAVLPAILVELSLYFASGFEKTRLRFEKAFSEPVRALCLTVSGLVPYSLYTVPLGLFRWDHFLLLALLAGAVSFWFVMLPAGRITDVLLLALLASVMLIKLFPTIYPRPYERLRVDFLGQLLWIRLGLMAFLSFRHVEGVRVGLIPRARDWVIGIRYFVFFMPLAAALNAWIGFARYNPPAAPWWQTLLLAAGMFAGVFWVLALGEEFFFRGLLQRWLTDWTANEWAGVVLASLLFGGVHLWFRDFPNWRFALLATIAGVFYGLAFRSGKGVRAAMITHSLVVVTWRVFFN